MIFSRAIPTALLLFLAFALPLRAADAEIESFTLSNGMKVILIPSTRTPAVTHMLWYRVGAADDFPGRSGLAHYNEHMMYQGTESVAGGVFAEEVSRHGGKTNAFTGRDYTAYYVSIAKDQLPMVMRMEADRMLHLAPTKQNFLKEREVIIEERRMSVENRPDALLGEEMQAALFRNHPYHTPIIGWMNEMQALSRDDVLAFHRQFYHPANAVLVVAGDITRAELSALAEKYYGSLPAGEPNVRHWREEPPQRGPRTVALKSSNVRQPELVRIYAASSAAGPTKALVLPSYVLSQILGGGTASRLYQSLVVRRKLATGVDADYSGFSIGPGQFEITVIPAEGVSLPQLEAALQKELDLISAEAVSADELTRAKVLYEAATTYTRDGLEGMANTLGGLIMAGFAPDYFNRWPELIDHVTAEDVKNAAQATFRESQSVTGYLLPESPPADETKGDAK